MIDEGELPPLDSIQGWVVVFGSFCAQWVVFGTLYAFSLFITEYEEAFGVSRAEVSVMFILQLSLNFGGGAVAGPLSDKLGPRPVLMIGALLHMSGLIIGALSENFTLSVIAHGLLVGAGNPFIYWPSLSVVVQWFEKHRGLAAGASALGAGLGNLAVAFYLGPILENGTYQDGLRTIAYQSGALLVVAILLVRRRAPKSQKGQGLIGQKRVFLNRDFQLLCAGALLFQFGFNTPVSSLGAYAESVGLSKEDASFVVAMIGAGSSAGRIVFGVLSDIIGIVPSFRIAIFSTACSTLAIYFATTRASLIAVSFLFGLASGSFIALVPLVVAFYFGPARVATFLGIVSLFLLPGSLVSPVVTGKLFDDRGDYELAIFLAAGFIFGSTALTLMLRTDVEPIEDFSKEAVEARKVAGVEDITSELV